MNRPSKIFFFLLALSLSSCSPSQPSPSERISPSSCEHRLVSAHRGDRDEAPDNSLPAIQAAITKHIPLIEIDVRVTKEGTPFLLHPARLHEEHFLLPPDLQEHSANDLHDTDLSRIQTRDERKLPVALFRDALLLLRDTNTSFQLDLKKGNAAVVAKIVEIAKQEKLESHLIFQISRLEDLRNLRNEYPDLPALFRAETAEDALTSLQFRPVIVQVDRDILSEGFAQEVHRSNALVLVKALDQYDDTDGWKELYEEGADILLTDHPGPLWIYSHSQPDTCR